METLEAILAVGFATVPLGMIVGGLAGHAPSLSLVGVLLVGVGWLLF